MPSPTPTPAHQAFREKRAEDWVKRECVHHVPGEHPHITASVNKTNRTIFLAGMEAEHEVARLMGRIGMLNQMGGYQHHPRVASILERALDEAESQLAALLEGK